MPGSVATLESNSPSPHGATGEEITNSLGMPLVLIPAGEFQMGADHSPDFCCPRAGFRVVCER